MKSIVLNTVRKSSSNYRKYRAIVDDKNFEQVNNYKWSILKSGDILYAHGRVNGDTVLMHAFITGFKHTDHIDGNGLNNQQDNLRRVTQSQNLMNMHKSKGTTSKYKGVSWNREHNKWIVFIKKNGKNNFLGYFGSEINAAQAYNFAAEKYFGEYAKFNH